MAGIIVTSFYRFVHLPDFREIRSRLQEVCDRHRLKGSILLAEEGINAMLAGPRESVDAVMHYLRGDDRLSDLIVRESVADSVPFKRLKVRLKREIVKFGRAEADPNRQVGCYVAPEEWNRLIRDPDVTVIDTRNEFEVGIGTFQGALNPSTTSFGQFPRFVENNLDPSRHRKIAMFCTGGIRCEKATSYLLEKGFQEVYHLEGGILNYLEQVPREESLWHGECFVFDDRVSLDHDLERGTYRLCFACSGVVSDEETRSPQYEEGVSCPNCYDSLSQEKRVRLGERQRQIELARRREAAA